MFKTFKKSKNFSIRKCVSVLLFIILASSISGGETSAVLHRHKRNTALDTPITDPTDINQWLPAGRYGIVQQACLRCIKKLMDYGKSCSGNQCGPFGIQMPYYNDASAVNNLDNSDYKRCVLDYYCAASTVQNYMWRYNQDCNGNGVYGECRDFAYIHLLGPNGCSNTPPQRYLDGLDSCYNQQG
ncbi:invertebrate-type lysozyme 3-like [Neocloeon triangulifer]|uniref:invertebrate-type lysozyme 3-like n=1 Tax=Neocloeon triangulifer TaxID=2078957 RepID=UPI00286EF4A9|nr:invertebrate-type lysozyme 3-like [Neocloeon triangulifer]